MRALRGCLLIILTIFPLELCDAAPKQPTAGSRFARRVRAEFGVTMPCSLSMCEGNLDGGTVSCQILGAGPGESIEFSLPARLVVIPSPPPWIRADRARLNAWADSIVAAAHAKPNPLYIGRTYYALPGAVPVPIGSAKESLLIELLRTAPSRPESFGTPAIRARAEQAALRVAGTLEEQRARLGRKHDSK